MGTIVCYELASSHNISITRIMFQALQRAIQITLVTLMALQCANSMAAPKCQAATDNHYEQVFCQLSSSRYGYGLPSIHEFRRNPANVQYLLLKRAASREGIALQKPLNASRANGSRSGAAVLSAATQTQKPIPDAKRNHSSEDVGQRGCRYTALKIDCADRQYRLRTNLLNSELPNWALSDANVLRLPQKRAVDSVETWLAKAYQEYIVALLSIGLAGSSSTYSAFAHTYYELENSSTDFATRIQDSFAMLKKDKRTLAASKRYPESAPSATDCEWLASTMLACNSAGKNWVYTSD
ncbi:MAG: hypothetical protein AAF542_18210 [Pseudomonadota bacterium]